MPNLTSMFPGMESYLEGDVEINNTVTAPDESGDVAAAETAADSAEVSADVAEASKDAQETETATMLLDRMCTMYQHVKQFGIDRTFVSLYNRHGELDRVCGMSFPSCESMDAVGDRYSRYSQAFIAAMESSKDGFIAKIKAIIGKVWEWIKNTLSKIWDKIKSIFGMGDSKLKRAMKFIKANMSIKKMGKTGWNAIKGAGKWAWNHKTLTALIATATVAVLDAARLAGDLAQKYKGQPAPESEMATLQQKSEDAQQKVEKITSGEGVGMFKALGMGFIQEGQDILATGKDIIDFVKNVIPNIKNADSKLGAMKDELMKIVKGVYGGIARVGNDLYRPIGAIIGKIISCAKTLLSKITDLFSKGGKATAEVAAAADAATNGGGNAGGTNNAAPDTGDAYDGTDPVSGGQSEFGDFYFDDYNAFGSW